MRRFFQWLFGGGVKTTIIDPKPYRGADSRSGETIRAGSIPPKVEARKPLAPHWSDRDLNAMPEDHLGKAAIAKHAAKAAIKEKRFNDAWRLLHEQQEHWLSHANRARFSKAQTLSLLSSINEDFANIHRLESRHDDALAHIIYALATDRKPTQALQKKLGAYFKRCKFDSAYTVERAELGVKMLKKEPDLRMAQEFVSSLRDGSAPTGK